MIPSCSYSPARVPSSRVVRDDPFEGDLQGVAQVGIEAFRCLLDLRGGDPEAGRDVHPVEGRRAADDCGVSVGAHAGQDAGHRIVHVGAGRIRARQRRVVRRRGAAEVQYTEGHEHTRLPACPRCTSRTDRTHMRHHRGMSTAAEISSLSSTLQELHEPRDGHGRGRLGPGRRGHGARADRGGAFTGRRAPAAAAFRAGAGSALSDTCRPPTPTPTPPEPRRVRPRRGRARDPSSVEAVRSTGWRCATTAQFRRSASSTTATVLRSEVSQRAASSPERRAASPEKDSTSVPASSSAMRSLRASVRYPSATVTAGTSGTIPLARAARCSAHIMRSPRAAACRAPSP